MSGPEISLVLVFNLVVSFPVSWALGVLCRLVGPVFPFRGTMELSVYPWISVLGCYLFGWYMVSDHLVDGSFDVLPHVVH